MQFPPFVIVKSPATTQLDSGARAVHIIAWPRVCAVCIEYNRRYSGEPSIPVCASRKPYVIPTCNLVRDWLFNKVRRSSPARGRQQATRATSTFGLDLNVSRGYFNQAQLIDLAGSHSDSQ